MYVLTSCSTAIISDHRKEKSLGLLTQNFVKLFLTMEVSDTELLPVLLGLSSFEVDSNRVCIWCRWRRSHWMKLLGFS